MSGEVKALPADRLPDAWLRARSEAFMRATQGRGKPSVYGHGKPPEEKGSKKS